MTPLLLPYLFKILVLVPIGLLTLFGGERGGRLGCQGKFPESEVFAPSSARSGRPSWSVIGLFHPAPMSPLLLIQVIYKALWLVVFVLPRLLAGRSGEGPWGISLTFLVIVLSYPWAIQWGRMFAGSCFLNPPAA